MAHADIEARRAYGRAHYRANKSVYKERAMAHKKKAAIKIRSLIWDYLKQNPCIDCGESDPTVLEFDHRDDENKLFNISDCVSSGYAAGKVLAEIEKCDARCANCHRRRTAKSFGWFCGQDDPTLH